ncbi:MAG: ABC transporter permease [Halobacteriota archaeon]|nr:ABC transporter permease [Halobacteriota archaeon]
MNNIIDKVKNEKLFLIFAALGLIIILFILITLGNMVATQFLTDFKGFTEAVQDDSVWMSIFLTLYTSFLATLIAFIFGVPLAYVLARKDFWGKGIIESIIDVPVIVPHTVAGIALLTVFGRHGLIGSVTPIGFVDALPGIVVAMLFVSLPFLINSAREGFQSVDPRLENIARTLGTSGWGSFRRVTFPLASRHLLVGSIMSWARGISEFGAVVIIAYYPMITPTLIYERFLSTGLSASRPVAVLLIMVCLTIFIFLRLISSNWRRYDKD